MIFEALATICAGLFAGAAVYISLVQHPARLECGTELAATEFGPTYRRASRMQASLAAGGFLTALAAAFLGHELPVLAAGLVLGSVIPFTLLAMLPQVDVLTFKQRAQHTACLAAERRAHDGFDAQRGDHPGLPETLATGVQVHVGFAVEVLDGHGQLRGRGKNGNSGIHDIRLPSRHAPEPPVGSSPS